ncbi:N-acetylmuramoyl-L-alanine amidase, partial [Micromonosporaceae bacterium Da 78-11]
MLCERTTGPFSLLGVTWTEPEATVSGVVQVRTRDRVIRRWSDWHTLHSHAAVPGDARGSTDPLWVGESDGVQARINGTGLPRGLRIDLINPGAPATAPGAGQHPRPNPRMRSVDAEAAIALPARPVPQMITRAGWGADEAIVHGAPQYTG